MYITINRKYSAIKHYATRYVYNIIVNAFFPINPLYICISKALRQTSSKI